LKKAVLLLSAVTVLVLGMVVYVGGATAQEDPPGNNGTVKIDGVEFDSHPDNQPHVGCVFQVDFYGFDEGDLNATVTFETQPPTTPVTTLLTDTVFIGEDDNSGGGSEAGLDASETYDLTALLVGFEPHDIQGFHIKLTVNAPGSIGADTKFKVFWVTGCETPPTTTTSSPPPPPVTTTTTTSSVPPPPPPPGVTTTTTTSEAPPPPSESESPPDKEEKTATKTKTPNKLAFTGPESIVPIGAIALFLASAGSGLMWLSSKRKRDDED
jgi:cell division septation protein DedD